MDYLKCDKYGCDHIEDAPDYGPHLIGKGCPKCGSNLLTEKDFNDYEPIRNAIKFLESIGMARIVTKEEADENKSSFNVRVHNGEITIKTKKDEG